MTKAMALLVLLVTVPVFVSFSWAKQLPSTRPVTWTQLIDAAHPPPDGYRLVLDAAPAITVPPCAPVPTTCTSSVVVLAVGTHTLSVTPFINTGADAQGNTVLGGDGPTLSITFSARIPGNSGNLIIK
jgi:hypothetical protein